ncbi:hypothetical protein PVE_R1G5829 [Pseudomonas veronii 1YdBTEX2]|uniref:Uncharacterized protein n=1 Tax=Pseudomonas veronii 1YdBTEX2 TaxID=1295141 RepID=A0A1D3K5V0_PSEVE|nr:hypothetical protein [Pseudomonas veronii]SBW83709.1 hypothetical protein PVE_R1G5829 [Pseudomonas veronii 1YdBTEX2]
MNGLKSTTMLWKRMNYSAQQGRVKNTPGISQLKSSLDHSLRTVMKKELEFNQDLAHRNFIIRNNKMIRLDSLTLEDRQSLVNEILSSVQSDVGTHEGLSKLKDDRSKYAYKLKKLLSKADEPESLKTLINGLLDAQSSTLSTSLVDQVDSMNVKRVNDKKKAIGTYIKLHNEIVAAGNNSLHKSKTVLQECFFKFPARNNVNEVKPVDYLRIIYDFHTKYLSDYEIKTCVFHGDEVLSQEQINNAVHPHIFISGKNTKSGQYDLVQAQLNLVNRYLKSKGEPVIQNNSFTASQKIGETYQCLVYEYVNKRLKEFGYSIEASIHEKTKEHKEKLKTIAKDANKAKIMRGFNLLSMSENELKKAEQEKNDLTDQQRSIKNKILFIDKLRLRLVKKNNQLAEQANQIKAVFSDTKAAVDILTDQKRLLEEQNNSLLENIESNERALGERVRSVEKAIALLAYTAREQQDMKRVFAEFKESNFNMLKSLSPSERVYYMYNIRERLAREGVDVSGEKILNRTDSLKLSVSDAYHSLKKFVSKRKPVVKETKPKN